MLLVDAVDCCSSNMEMHVLTIPSIYVDRRDHQLDLSLRACNESRATPDPYARHPRDEEAVRELSSQIIRDSVYSSPQTSFAAALDVAHEMFGPVSSSSHAFSTLIIRPAVVPRFSSHICRLCTVGNSSSTSEANTGPREPSFHRWNKSICCSDAGNTQREF